MFVEKNNKRKKQNQISDFVTREFNGSSSKEINPNADLEKVTDNKNNDSGLETKEATNQNDQREN